MNKKLYKSWKLEEKHSFKGWDFSYLDTRWECESLPWDYKTIVLSYLKAQDNLLDMGTGGGEFLLSLNHPYKQTAVTEGYPPNYDLCKQKLEPLGITVKYVKENDQLLYKDNTFDIIINRHESFSYEEVKRVLKPNGIFITQQVGEDNNYSLSKGLIKDFTKEYGGWNLKNVITRLENHQFSIIYRNEYFPYLRFFDVGAIVYYAKIIEWEFPEFSVEKCYDNLIKYHSICVKDGFVETFEHRFIIVCINNK